MQTLPDSTITNGIERGAYVRSSRHGHEGRVYKFEKLTNEDADWVALQSIPYTLEEIQDTHVGILCHGGGSVSVPASTCEVVPTIEDFDNDYNEEYFPAEKGHPKFNRQTFYIMKAWHLTSSGRKLGLKKICRDEPNVTCIVASRDGVPAFILGSAGNYGVAADEIHGYVIDTGNGYKGAGCLEIIDVLQIRDGEIVKGSSDHANAYTWVMK